MVSSLNIRIFLAQPSTDEKKNKSRFFSGFYIGSKKTAPPFLVWDIFFLSSKNYFK